MSYLLKEVGHTIVSFNNYMAGCDIINNVGQTVVSCNKKCQVVTSFN